MLFFEVRGKLEYPEKNSQSRVKNQQQTQPRYDAGSGSQNPGHIGGRRVFSRLRHPCFPVRSVSDNLKLRSCSSQYSKTEFKILQ